MAIIKRSFWAYHKINLRNLKISTISISTIWPFADYITPILQKMQKFVIFLEEVFYYIKIKYMKIENVIACNKQWSVLCSDHVNGRLFVNRRPFYISTLFQNTIFMHFALFWSNFMTSI